MCPNEVLKISSLMKGHYHLYGLVLDTIPITLMVITRRISDQRIFNPLYKFTFN